jgi:prevent-host-death family protein
MFREAPSMKTSRVALALVVNSTDLQNNFGKYLELASKQEIVITKKGKPVARLLGMEKTVSFLSDQLVGLVPRDINENKYKDEMLAKQSALS